MSIAIEARGPGRPRCEGTRQAILRAAYNLLEEGGIAAFTIEAVAQRSGAAKTTIYRWWPNKGALAIESFLDVVEKQNPFPQTASAIADLKTQLRGVARLFRGRVGQLVSSIVVEAQTDPETRRAFIEGYINPRRAAARKVLERGIASGELRADLDFDLACDALYGAIYMRLLLRHAGLGDAAVDQLAETVLDGLRPRAESKRQPS
jgi:AcrR family transcriptional regulator